MSSTYYVETLDKRNVEVLRLLKEKGFDAAPLNDDSKKEKSKDAVYIFSPARKFTADEVNAYPEGITVFCGSVPAQIKEIFDKKQIIHKNFMADEIFVIKNSFLTVDGILALMIENNDIALNENDVLILGYGRLGAATAQVFSRLGLKFSVANYGKERFFSAHQLTDKCYLGESFKRDLDKFNLIINTIPAQIFTDEDLLKIKPGTLFLETASVNCLNKEKVKDFTYLPAPALPMKFCFKTAAGLMADLIEKTEE